MISFIKPVNYLEMMRTGLAPAAKNFDIPPKETIRFNDEKGEHYCWFLQHGSLSIYRESNELLLELVSSPVLLTFANDLIPTTQQYHMVTETRCKGFYLPVDLAFEQIDKHQLWKAYSHWQAWQMRIFEWRDACFTGASTYAQIRSTLLIMADWDKEIRSKIGVINFIQKRTHISRSVIAEILAALRKGNYIEMSKGKLIAVNRLPNNY